MMKITRRQLKRIIKEEKQRLAEGRMAEMEMQLADEIIDLLIERRAIAQDGNEYGAAADYLRSAIVPVLDSLR